MLSQVTPNGETCHYALAAWVFLRLLAIVYLCAFISLATQVKGLIGQQGILPAADFLKARRRYRWKRFWRIPTLCWLNCSDGFLSSLCWGGALLSVLLSLGIAPVPVLLLLWIAYLSLFIVGRDFLGYQWDILLLETGFLAIFLAPCEWLPRFPPAEPPPIVLWLFWWLLFRLMFSSGFVKLRSGDRHWRQLTALTVHYETQPLPTRLAWHAHQLPLPVQRVSALLMLAIELGAPWLIFAPPALRYSGALLIIFLMAAIQLTGNYSFFNLLAAVLTVLLVDDRVWIRLLAPVFPQLGSSVDTASNATLWPAAGIAVFIAVLSVPVIARLFRREITWPGPLRNFFDFLDPFHLVNSYGLFSVITPERPEIIIEGSKDGTTWEPYEFKWKPGDPKRPPGFVAPHQPRLDWQMWFAALGFAESNPWFERFLSGLLKGSPEIIGLLRRNPFATAPPRFVRAVLYRYHFSSRKERLREGVWWTRDRRGLYCPVAEQSMKEPA